MTMRSAHLAPGHKRKAVNALDQLMQNRAEEVFENANGTKLAQFEKNVKACLS
ncbi:MAG: hypothetical protein MRK01_03760 [Candidatus Scalindua sp.]|nr:hypothetical protein [Candidatus Scalindua sp.]